MAKTRSQSRSECNVTSNSKQNLELEKYFVGFDLKSAENDHRMHIHKQKTERSAAKSTVKPLTVIINDCWRKLKASSFDNIRIEDLVMAKMSGYCPWPGQVKCFTWKTRVQIFFFGENNYGTVDKTDIVPFEKCNDVIKLLLLRKCNTFHKAVSEVETILQVRPEFSLFNEYKHPSQEPVQTIVDEAKKLHLLRRELEQMEKNELEKATVDRIM